MRILIVEDDPGIHRSIAEDLRRQHHIVDVVEDGLTGLDFAGTGVYDVLLLDILLPELDGLELCRRLRAKNPHAFVLMVTALDDVANKVSALDSGADDYLVKPVDLAELSARIRAVSRRRASSRHAVLEHGGLRLDPSFASATYNGSLVRLTATEFVILETLMRSPLQVFSNRMLREKVASFDDDFRSDSVKTHITNIRRKVRIVGGVRDLIDNVYGVGYRLANVGSGV